MSEQLNEIAGWDLKLFPANAFIRVGNENPVANVKLNLQTLQGLAGIKSAPYVNISKKADGDERHFYESTTNEYAQPYIALRLNEDDFSRIENYLLSPNLRNVSLSIRVEEREIKGSKMFFAGEVDFDFTSNYF